MQTLTGHDDVSPQSNAVLVSRTSSTWTLTSHNDMPLGSNVTAPVLESEVFTEASGKCQHHP